MFEQAFKNIDDILHKDAGCGSELDDGEQSSWILFLKYLEDFEKDRQATAELRGKHCLGDRLEEVESLLEVMAKMTTRQAEIFSTTFPAWNNLLILGKPCEVDSIVLEARENWHPKKLKMAREKFLKSIAWIREK